MTDPLNTDDDWADLAREFNLDKPSAPADMVERIIDAEAVEPHHADPRTGDEAAAEGEPESAAGEEFEDAEDGAPGEAAADGEPGTGRKRRRRRRRRKGARAADGAVVGAAPADAEGEAETDIEAEEEPVAEAVAAEGDDYEVEAEEADAEPVRAGGGEEDTANEVLRDLIATWNVPSWDEIVSGLYRPN